jgi:hypothetical protein
MVDTISPQSNQSKWIKLPLILLLAMAGTLCGLSMSFIKCSVELNEITVLTVTLFGIGGVASICQMFLLNLAMKYYD